VTAPSQAVVPELRSPHSADASLAIPFDEQAVLTGVKSALQEEPSLSDEHSREPEILCFDGVTIDLASRTLHDYRGREVPLTRSEFALLVVLARHPGRVLSRDRLLDAGLGRQMEPYDRSIDVLIGRLRKKIEPVTKAPRFIVTVPGEGYKFAAKPHDSRPRALPLTSAATAEEGAPQAPLHPERRQLTVLSCGLVEAAALTSQLDPEDLRAIIVDYHRCCTEVIGGFGGLVATPPGERIVAYFGYPEANEHDAERAVRAGLALCDCVTKLEIGLAPTVHVRVGIASGLVVVGGAGCQRAGDDPVAIGEAPHLAAQLQSISPPDTVVIAASTRHLVRGLFDYHELGKITPNGLAKPLPAWRVIGTGAAASRFEALRGESLTRLIGRDEEIGLLLRRWQRVQSGEGRVVLISGEPGIGKSRLVHALQDRVNGDAVLSFHCSPNYQDSPLYPLITQFERAAGFKRDDDPAERVKKFEALVHPAIGVEAIGLIGALLSVPIAEGNPEPSLSPQRRKDKTLRALVEELAALAREQPILLIFEDAHWIDPTSRELLDLIVDRIRALPVLLLITYRPPEFTSPWASHAHATTMVLNRLDDRQVTTLAEQISGKRLPPEVNSRLIAHSDGVPLFVEELVKNVMGSGLLRELDDEYLLRGPLPALAIPNTLQGLLVARLDQ
jgi:class 3 adenylate cyclase